MPRQKNTKPTSIYWLYDTRPETIADGWAQGKPFYCGKTVENPERRLQGHRSKAVHNPFGNVGARILECGEFLRIETVEIVPVEQDWEARERHWINTLRVLWPNCTNISDGGHGSSPGHIKSAETRAKLSFAAKNRSIEHITRLGAATRGKKLSAEHRMKLSIAAKNRSPEFLASLRARKLSPETRAKLSVANKGKTIPPETRAKISAALKGKRKSPEHRAKTSAAATGRIISPETRAKLCIGQQRRRAVALRCYVPDIIGQICLN